MIFSKKFEENIQASQLQPTPLLFLAIQWDEKDQVGWKWFSKSITFWFLVDWYHLTLQNIREQICHLFKNEYVWIKY